MRRKLEKSKMPQIIITHADITDDRKDEESSRYFSYSGLTQWMRKTILLFFIITLLLAWLFSGFLR
jgi:hypothetical protein